MRFAILFVALISMVVLFAWYASGVNDRLGLERHSGYLEGHASLSIMVVNDLLALAERQEESMDSVAFAEREDAIRTCLEKYATQLFKDAEEGHVPEYHHAAFDAVKMRYGKWAEQHHRSEAP